ncbi:MAG TPA: alpha/beta fold hydrolase [Stellaceae bacterium]|nr:alpha/beta fold hydrolase [Stellaceae bacterium]
MSVVAAAKPAASRRMRFREIDGFARGPACYMELGAAKASPLVFLHGFGGDLLTWQYCLGAFTGRFRVIALDLPGHGRSSGDVGPGDLAFMVGWVVEALAALDIPAAHFVGHSMGAKIAIGLALARPELALSLNLVSPAGLGGFFDKRLLHDFLDCSTDDAVTYLAGRLLGPASAGLVDGLARSLKLAHDPARAAGLEKLLGNASAIEEAFSETGTVPWARIGAPIQVVWGRADSILPLPEVHRLPPGAPVTVLDGIGHMPQLECPTQLISLIDRFLP